MPSEARSHFPIARPCPTTLPFVCYPNPVAFAFLAEEHAISKEFILKCVCKTTKAKVILLDACRSVPKSQQKRSAIYKGPSYKGTDPPAGSVARLGSSKLFSNRVIIQSCCAGGVSFAGDEKKPKELVRMPLDFAHEMKLPSDVPHFTEPLRVRRA